MVNHIHARKGKSRINYFSFKSVSFRVTLWQVVTLTFITEISNGNFNLDHYLAKLKKEEYFKEVDYISISTNRDFNTTGIKKRGKSASHGCRRPAKMFSSIS